MNDSKTFYRLEPIVTERTWGGNRLAEKLNITTEIDRAGEIIAAAGFKNRNSPVSGLGIRLSQLFDEQPELFGVEDDYFPLTVNLIDAVDNLSVQVHPNTGYAKRNEDCCGSPEAWIVIECEPESQILVGHNAESNIEFAQLVQAGSWDKLFRSIPVKEGDFIFLPPGTVHSIGKGVCIYEVTHASDVVYRLYDYGRNDNNRPLDTQKALDVIYSPQCIDVTPPEKVAQHENLIITKYIDEAGLFTVCQLEVHNNASYTQSDFGVLTVIKGQGTINDFAIEIGQSILIPCGINELRLEGVFTAMLSTYRP